MAYAEPAQNIGNNANVEQTLIKATAEISPNNPGSLCGLFGVETDYLSRVMPSLEQLTALVEEMAPNQEELATSADSFSQQRIALKQRRERKVLTNSQGLHNAAAEMIGTLVPLVRNAPTPEERSDAIRAQLSPYVKDDEAFGYMCAYVEYVLPILNTFVEISPKVIAEVESHIGNDRTRQYALIKAIGANAPNPDRPEDDITECKLVAAAFTAESMQAANEESYAHLLRRLAALIGLGAFDDLIARDTLEWLNTPGLDTPPPLRPLRNMSLLMQACVAVPAAEIAGKLSANIELWPGEAKLALKEAKTSLQQRFNTTMEGGKAFLSEMGLLTYSVDPQKAFDRSITNLVAVRTGVLPSERRNATKHEMMLERARRKNGQQQVAGAAAVKQTIKVETATPEPKRLVRISMTGATYSADSEQFKELQDDYLDHYKGVPGIREDIQRVLEYMTLLDFSSGTPRGIKKYNGSLLEYPVFGFKAIDAVGLPTSTQRAKKLRVLFCMLPDDTLGILALADRADVPKIERNLGITSGAK